jgi:hypothetical protein
MSKQKLAVVDLAAEACCPPLSQAAITSDDAAELAPGFKALDDRVRSGRLSVRV